MKRSGILAFAFIAIAPCSDDDGVDPRRVLTAVSVSLEGSALPFALDAVDDVRLVSRYGVQVDRMLWISRPTAANGRCPGGADLFRPTTVLTKAAANACPP